MLRSLKPLGMMSLGVLVLAIALVPEDARACSCRGMPVTVPAQGSTGVPLNAQVQVLGALDAFLGTLRLQRTDGTEVPFDVVAGSAGQGFLRLRPRALLRPLTEYVLELELEHPGGTLELTRFTTGDAEDASAPSFEGVRGSRYEGSSRLLPVSSCGHWQYHRFDAAPAQDDMAPEGALFFHVYTGSDAESIDFAQPTRVLPANDLRLGEAMCNPLSFPLDDFPDLAVVVTAVDWAGNESPPGRPLVLQRGGLGCSAGGSVAAPLALMLGLGVLWCGRKRRPRAHLGAR